MQQSSQLELWPVLWLIGQAAWCTPGRNQMVATLDFGIGNWWNHVLKNFVNIKKFQLLFRISWEEVFNQDIFANKLTLQNSHDRIDRSNLYDFYGPLPDQNIKEYLKYSSNHYKVIEI